MMNCMFVMQTGMHCEFFMQCLTWLKFHRLSVMIVKMLSTAVIFSCHVLLIWLYCQKCDMPRLFLWYSATIWQQKIWLFHQSWISKKKLSKLLCCVLGLLLVDIFYLSFSEINKGIQIYLQDRQYTYSTLIFV